LEEVKTAAALRWVNAVNSDRRYGSWRYGIIKKIAELDRYVEGELDTSA
jgi:hypothetical protein